MKTIRLRASFVILLAGVALASSQAEESAPGKKKGGPASASSGSAAPPAIPPELRDLPPASVIVDSIAALQSSIEAALPGDTITLKNGSYTTNVPIMVLCHGTAKAPITITAESVGGAEIAGTNGFNLVEPAAYIVVSGFKFTHASGKNAIGLGTANVRFTRNTFRCTGEGAYLSVSGDDAQIDYNEFADKKAASGSMVAVGGTGSQVARRVWIHHNYFHDFGNAGATGSEMIRLGLGALSASTGAGVVEYNLLVRCRGENDLISNRSSGNTYRYNTLLDSPTSHLTLRHGNDCLVYGNVFRHTEGLRIFGDRHQVFSNYFEGNYIGINLGNGSAEMSEGGSLSGHDRPDNCLIAFNTLVDNRTHYQMSRRVPEALGATNTTFANNLISGTGIAAKIEGPNAGAVWSGNLLWTTDITGDFPAEGYTKADPLLVADANGIKRPQSGSPAIEAATGAFPTVTFDLDGQTRPEKKSIGADEVSTEPAASRVLSPADVGPAAVIVVPAAVAAPVTATPTAKPPTPAPAPVPVPTPVPVPAETTKDSPSEPPAP